MARQKQQHKKKPLAARARMWVERHPYWTAFLAGCAYFSVIVSWMFGIKTAEIAQGIAVKFVAFSAGIIMVSSLAMGFVFFVWLMRRLKVRLDQPRAVWLVPTLWVVSEYGRAIFFSITSLGPDGRVGPYWTFGHIGYYFAETPLAFMARLGGLYLLSFVGVAIVVALYQLIRYRRVRPILIVAGVSAALSLAGAIIYARPNGRSLDVGTVKFAYRSTAYQMSNQSYDLLKKGISKPVDVLVMPEYSHYFDIPTEVEADKAVVQPLMKQPNGLIIHSARENIMQLGHNMLTFQAADGTVLNQQRKWFVVPAGEYVPYIYQVILAYAGQERLLLNFNAQKSVVRGDKPEVPYTYDGVRFGAHACSGVLAPDFYNQLAQSGSDIFTNSAALDTMGIAPLFHYQAEQMNRLAAIAHAKPFVQSAKGGPAYIMDKDGRELVYSFSNDGAVLSAQVQTNRTKTLYGWLGDWVVYLSIITTTYLLIREHVPGRKKNQADK